LTCQAAWSLSNITAGPPEQIQMVIDAGALRPLIDLLGPEHDVAIRREACWAVSNAAAGGTQEQALHIAAMNIVQPLGEHLDCGDRRVHMVPRSL